MAMETLLEKKLVLAFSEGIDEAGKEIVKRYTYSNLQSVVTPDALVEAATALSTLFNGTVYEFTTVDSNLLN